jgi:hypothetical protein
MSNRHCLWDVPNTSAVRSAAHGKTLDATTSISAGMRVCSVRASTSNTKSGYLLEKCRSRLRRGGDPAKLAADAGPNPRKPLSLLIRERLLIEKLLIRRLILRAGHAVLKIAGADLRIRPCEGSVLTGDTKIPE